MPRPYHQLQCGLCATLVEGRYAIDRQLAMTRHYKQHDGQVPRFDMETWDTRTVWPAYGDYHGTITEQHERMHAALRGMLTGVSPED